MIYSMTGFGQASRDIGDKQYSVEIKSLNGKNSDIRFKSNVSLKDKEMELRKLVTEYAKRGKFDLNLNVIHATAENNQINLAAMEQYYAQLAAFMDNKDLGRADVLQTLIRLPNVVEPSEGEISSEEWKVIADMVKEAIDMLNGFRKSEGESLKSDFSLRVNNILAALDKIEPYVDERIETIRIRIKKNLSQHLSDESVDKNRFEQEILFYLEKLDLNEERVRLRQHCNFFIKELEENKMLKGKKLNFISQEMGREINTLGAKAQHSEVQQIVVEMKDELEKIKEQVLNTL